MNLTITDIQAKLSPCSLQDDAMNFIGDILEDSASRGYPDNVNISQDLFRRFHFPAGTTWKILDFLKGCKVIESYNDDTKDFQATIKGFDKDWSCSIHGLNYKKLEEMKNILLIDFSNRVNSYLKEPEQKSAEQKTEKQITLEFDLVFQDIEIDTKNLVFCINQKKVDITGAGRAKMRKGVAAPWCMVEKQRHGQGFVSREGLGKAVFEKLKESGLLEKVRKPKYFRTYATDSLSFARKILEEYDSVCKIYRDSLSISVSKSV